MDFDDIFKTNTVSKTIVISEENYLGTFYSRPNSLVQKKLEQLSEKGYDISNITYYVYEVAPQLLFKYFFVFNKYLERRETYYWERFKQYHFAYDKTTLTSYDKSRYSSADDEVSHLLKIIDNAEKDYFSTKFDRFIFKTFQEVPEFLGHSFKKYPVLQKKAIFFTAVLFAAIFVLALILYMNGEIRSPIPILLVATPFALIYFSSIKYTGKLLFDREIELPLYLFVLYVVWIFFLYFLILASVIFVVLIGIVPFCLFWLIGSLFYDNIW